MWRYLSPSVSTEYDCNRHLIISACHTTLAGACSRRRLSQLQLAATKSTWHECAWHSDIFIPIHSCRHHNVIANALHVDIAQNIGNALLYAYLPSYVTAISKVTKSWGRTLYGQCYSLFIPFTLIGCFFLLFIKNRPHRHSSLIGSIVPVSPLYQLLLYFSALGKTVHDYYRNFVPVLARLKKYIFVYLLADLS